MKVQQEKIARQILQDRTFLTDAHAALMVAAATGLTYEQAEALVKSQK